MKDAFDSGRDAATGRTPDCPTLDALAAHFAGTLLAEESARLQAHLAACAPCRRIALDFVEPLAMAPTSPIAADPALTAAAADSARPARRRGRRLAMAAQLLAFVGAGIWLAIAFRPGAAADPLRAFSFDVLGDGGAQRSPGAAPPPAGVLEVTPGQSLTMAFSAAEDLHLWVLLAAPEFGAARLVHRGPHLVLEGVTSFLHYDLPGAAELPAQSFVVAIATRAPPTAAHEARVGELLRNPTDAAALQRALEELLEASVRVTELRPAVTAADGEVGWSGNRPGLRQRLGEVQAMIRSGEFAAARVAADALAASWPRDPPSASQSSWWERGDLARAAALATRLAAADAETRAGFVAAERLRAETLLQLPLLAGATGPPEGLADRLIEQCRAALALRAAALDDAHPLLTDLRHLEAKILLIGGRAREALELLERVRAEYAVTLGDRHPRHADALHDLSGAFRNVGLTEAAVLYATDALRGYELSAADPRQTFEVLRALADMHARLEATELARSYAQMASEALGALADDPEYWARQANAHVTHAGIHDQAGDAQRARTELESAWVLYERGGDARRADSVRFRLAELRLRAGDGAEAQALLLAVRAADLRAYGEHHPFVALDDYLLGLAADALGDRAEAERRLNAALERVEAARGAFDDLQERAAASHAIGLPAIATALSRVQLADGRVAQAFATQERGRARILLDLLGGESVSTPAPAERTADADDAARTARAHDEVDRALADSAVRADGGADGVLSAGHELARSVRDAWMAELVEDPAWRHALAADDTTSAAEIASLLDEGELLLAYSWSEDDLVAFLLDAQSAAVVTAFTLVTGNEELAALAELLTRALAGLAREDDAPAAQRIADLHSAFAALMPPALWDRVAGAPALYLVPDGPLARLPFEALVVAPGRSFSDCRFWLDDGPPVACLASASLLPALRALPRRATAQADWSALLVGNAQLADPGSRERETTALRALAGDVRAASLLAELRAVTPSSAALAEAEREVRILEALIERHAGRATVLVDADATVPRVLAAAPGHRVLHFATHGSIGDALRPYDAGLELRAASAPEGGTSRLRLRDVLEHWRQRLHGTELAILAACESGRAGAGAFADVSLPLGFHCAGVPAVVASAWRVDSAATLHLSCAFLDARFAQPERSPLAALRDAQRGLRAALPDPYFWAAFQFYGDAR